MTTLKDLSRALGVSVTQVSRALNGHADVNAETRARVLSVAEQMNYRPNASARKLATGRSGIVGLVLPDRPSRWTDGLFVEMVSGLSRYFSERDMLFVLHIADPKEDFVRLHERLINGGSLDGFVIVDPKIDDPRIAFLEKRNIPFVVHGRHVEAPDYPFFDIDNTAVGYRLTKILIAAGHKRIAFLNGNKGRSFAEARRKGYEQALREHGCEASTAFHLYGDMRESYGIISAVRFWGDNRKNGPTAVICGNMLVAKGVFGGLSALELSVPGDISVVAHDDHLPVLPSAGFPTPLTVTSAAISDAWQPMAELLVGTLQGIPSTQLQRYGELIVEYRESVAPPVAV